MKMYSQSARFIHLLFLGKHTYLQQFKIVIKAIMLSAVVTAALWEYNLLHYKRLRVLHDICIYESDFRSYS